VIDHARLAHRVVVHGFDAVSVRVEKESAVSRLQGMTTAVFRGRSAASFTRGAGPALPPQ
jgi:hypothetical protein